MYTADRRVLLILAASSCDWVFSCDLVNSHRCTCWNVAMWMLSWLWRWIKTRWRWYSVQTLHASFRSVSQLQTTLCSNTRCSGIGTPYVLCVHTIILFSFVNSLDSRRVIIIIGVVRFRCDAAGRRSRESEWHLHDRHLWQQFACANRQHGLPSICLCGNNTALDQWHSSAGVVLVMPPRRLVITNKCFNRLIDFQYWDCADRAPLLLFLLFACFCFLLRHDRSCSSCLMMSS